MDFTFFKLTTHIRSVLNYVGGGWQLWISNRIVEKLERVQNREPELYNWSVDELHI